MFRLLCSPHSFHLIELLTTSLILIIFFSFSRIVTEKPYQGSVNKLLYCIVLFKIASKKMELIESFCATFLHAIKV